MEIQIIGERPVIDVSSGVSAGLFKFREETVQEIVERNRWARLEARLEGRAQAEKNAMESWLENQSLEDVFCCANLPGIVYELVDAIDRGNMQEAAELLLKERKMAWERYKLAAEADANS